MQNQFDAARHYISKRLVQVLKPVPLPPSHWITRVLLPSGHPPSEDGIMWDYVFHRRDPMAV